MWKQIRREKRGPNSAGLVGQLARALVVANKELDFRGMEKRKRADELIVANKELAFQGVEKRLRADELIVANRELAFQGAEKRKRADELILANEELAYQGAEKRKRADELLVANEELAFQGLEKRKRADELIVANKELAFQGAEKTKRADELVVANRELAIQGAEKRKRADELVLANKELAYQGAEKRKRADELLVANEELAFQGAEKGKRANELILANKALVLQRDLSALQAQLQQSQKMESLGVLAGGVAHDMNNVLAAILGLASAFVEIEPDGTPAHGAFTTILKAATRGGDLVKGLLAFARQTLPSEQELDLNAILEDEVKMLSHTTLSKVQLEVDLAPDLPTILGDGSALTHAFMNLCVNAVDAMPEQGTLTLRTRNIENEWAEVVVEDNGQGMSEDVRTKAVDPFFTTKGPGKGTGLGLSIVHTTVTAHHGQLDIQSEPGHGTRVAMRFPVCVSAGTLPLQAVSETVESWGAGSSPAHPAKDALTVLVVDDDEMIRASLQTILDHLGHTIILARSGEEALAKLEAKFEPDIVILDMNMPGLGGFKTLPILRSLLPRVPVILATGRADQTAIDIANAYPFVTLLPKPFTIGELKKQIGQAVAL